MSEESITVSDDVQEQIRRLGPWFHNLHLPDGTQTNPDHWLGDFPLRAWREIEQEVPQDLRGWTCLDIGCNAGFYSFELAKRGAQVFGIDVDERFLQQARWAAERFGLQDQVEFHRMQVYDLARLDRTFDLVWFMGVLYHLRYPMLGLDIVAQKVRRMMVLQTLTFPEEQVHEKTWGWDFGHQEVMNGPGWPKMAFLEQEFAGDPTNWWAANRACVEAMLRSAGMRIVKRPSREIWFCEPDLENPSCIRTWNREEFAAATGCEVSSVTGHLSLAPAPESTTTGK
jgi:tRNA (mo5U34)-methyltransferase